MLVAALFLAACSGGGADDDLLELQATEEPAASAEDPDPSPSPEAEPEDPYAVPDEIDEAYVERVINAILEVQTEVLRGALGQATGENLAPHLVGLHIATTDGEQRRLGLDYLQDYIDVPESREGLREVSEIRSMTFAVDQLLHSEPDRCVIAAGRWDLSGTSTLTQDAEERVAFSLARIDENVDRSEGNPTPWAWQSHVVLSDSTGAPIPPEQWGDIDFGDHLDNSCEDFSG
jgi:hypothetical protein